jgi:hypothetical protein
VQKLAALLANIKQTWGQHVKRFTSWWASLDKEARLKFLLVGCSVTAAAAAAACAV